MEPLVVSRTIGEENCFACGVRSRRGDSIGLAPPPTVSIPCERDGVDGGTRKIPPPVGNFPLCTNGIVWYSTTRIDVCGRGGWVLGRRWSG
jgi:hypothetical protein